MNARLLGLLSLSAALGMGAHCAAGETNALSGTDSLRFEFHDAPIATVLNYLGENGFIVIQDVPVEGTVSAWSRQPLNREEAVDLLNSVLKPMGCGALLSGRFLTIYSISQAVNYDLPIKPASNLDQISEKDSIITQILPVRVGTATALAQLLRPLASSTATLVTTESGNCLVITGSQTDIKRVVKLVKAIESAGLKTGNIKIFRLRNGDAQNLANVVNQVFSGTGSTTTGAGQNTANNNANSTSRSSGGTGSEPSQGPEGDGMPGGEGPGGFGGPPGGNGPGND